MEIILNDSFNITFFVPCNTYIYIYIEREREREREIDILPNMTFSNLTYKIVYLVQNPIPYTHAHTHTYEKCAQFNKYARLFRS